MSTPSPTVVLHVGDVLDLLKTFPDNHFDDLFCDPPYGLSFMGYEWDHGVPSKAVWKEALRVLKPGGHLLAYGGTRKWHRLAVNIEDGGFEIRDSMMWLYGTGFPKGHDISKAIDKAVGSPVSETWEGYKTALKPAWEPLVLGMKSTEGTYAANALKHGVAGLNIEASRIGTTKRVPGSLSRRGEGTALSGSVDKSLRKETGEEDGHNPNIGRYPANLVLQHHPDCGTEVVEALECHADCPVRRLDEQTGVLKSGTGAVKRRSSSDHDGNGGAALGKESRP